MGRLFPRKGPSANRPEGRGTTKTGAGHSFLFSSGCLVYSILALGSGSISPFMWQLDAGAGGEDGGGKKKQSLAWLAGSIAGWSASSWRSLLPPMQRSNVGFQGWQAGWQEAAQDLVVSKYVTAPAARLAAQQVVGVEGREGVTTWGPRTRREG